MLRANRSAHRSEAIGDSYESLMTIEPAVPSTEVAVAIFKTCCDGVCDRPFDACANQPSSPKLIVNELGIGYRLRGVDA